MGKIGIISLPWSDDREQTWGEMVKICISERLPDGLARTFEEWESEYPESNLIDFMRSVASVAQNDLDEAEKYLDRHFERGGNTAHGKGLRYYIKVLKKENIKANKIYNEAISSGIKPEQFYRFLGETLLVADKLDDSVRFFRKSLVFRQENPQVWATLAHIFTKLKRYDEARTAISMAERYAKSERDLLNGAVHYIVFGNYEKAIKIYESVPVEEMVSPYHLINRGLVYFRMGNLDRAEECWQYALKINDKNAFAHYNLACLYAARGEFDRAWNHYQKAAYFSDIFIKDLEIDQDIQPLAKHPDYQDKIAELLRQLGK